MFCKCVADMADRTLLSVEDLHLNKVMSFSVKKKKRERETVAQKLEWYSPVAGGQIAAEEAVRGFRCLIYRQNAHLCFTPFSIMNCQMYRLDLEKAEEPEIELPTLFRRKSKRLPEKHLLFHYYTKAFDCVQFSSAQSLSRV